MTSPARPWWQLFLEGLAAPTDGIPKPEFVDRLGISPDGWEPETGEVRFVWDPPGWTRTPGGWVQGGFLGVVLDMAQTFALITRLDSGRVTMTLEMKVSFIDPSFGERYTVTARPMRWGRHVGHTEARLETGEGLLVATSTATHVIRTIPG